MSELTASLPRLRALLLAQRTVRLLLRAVWTGLAGYLIAWGIHELTGALPDHRFWLAMGLALALPSLLAIFRPLPMTRLAWNLDRRFALREQLSAAWQAAQHPSPSRLIPLLLSDAEALLPALRARLLRRGWFLAREGLAALIVAILFLTIHISRTYSLALTVPDSTPLGLPPLAEAPTYQDLFPSGIPGLTASPPAGPAPSDPLGPEQATTLDDLLSNLGQALSQSPETLPTGEALQQGDLEEAAAELERLADQLDALPPDARQNAQDALQRAAEQARNAGQEDLAEALQQAADSLEAPAANNLEAAEALDDLAGELRRLEEQFAALGQPGEQEPAAEPSPGDQPGEGEGAAAAGTGSSSQGQLEPLERLEGEGQTVEIEGGDTPSGMLTPGEPGGAPLPGGAPIIVAEGDPADTGLISSILTPYNFPWRWRDVVSQYFSPPQ